MKEIYTPNEIRTFYFFFLFILSKKSQSFIVVCTPPRQSLLLKSLSFSLFTFITPAHTGTQAYVDSHMQSLLISHHHHDFWPAPQPA